MARNELTTLVARRFTALLGFLRSEAVGGGALLLAAVVALIWSNSLYAPSYQAMLDLPIGVSAGGAGFAMPLQHWVNDALMALFFLLVSLEIRRELAGGELASLRRAAAPGLAALGGMVVPAAIYVAFNWHDASALRGWAVPVATDIAFSLAVLRVLGGRVPVALKVFLTALAIMDDLGAIVVIALAYTQDIVWGALAGAALVWLALYGVNRAGLRALSPYMLGGIALWVFVFHSGVHPTLAGVALALVVPMRGRAGEAETPARTLEAGLAGWVAYGILPVFGLTNAGLDLHDLPVGALTDPVVLGVTLGLFFGKQAGVFGTVVVARKLGFARLPRHISTAQLYGAALLCGIGFTMSLFIGDLAFRDLPRGGEVKLAVFVGSLLSAVAGLAMLALAMPRSSAGLPRSGVQLQVRPPPR